MPQSQNRNDAIKNGLKIYNGSPCVQCQSTEKWVTSYSCVPCNRIRVHNRDPNITKKYYEKFRSKGIKNPRKQNKKRKFEWSIKKRFNLTLEEYEKMVLQQNGLCKICNEKDNKKTRLSIDHCHKKGNVRALLCTRCNLTLGHVEEKVHILENMINYINFFEKGESV